LRVLPLRSDRAAHRGDWLERIRARLTTVRTGGEGALGIQRSERARLLGALGVGKTL
jgi:hypothetical protein